MKEKRSILVTLPIGADDIWISVVNGKVKITYSAEAEGNPNYEKYFFLVEVSKICHNKKFMEHTPQTERQRIFKQMVVEAIRSGLSDFKAPIIDPSVDEGEIIYYKKGSKPGVGYSPSWWYENSTKVIPGRSRLGTTEERIVFLASLIISGFATWGQICDHSEKIAHYWTSNGAKNDFDTTGSRPIGKSYDLGNTVKITKNKDGDGFSLVGGWYEARGTDSPLANIADIRSPNEKCTISVGWIVLS